MSGSNRADPRELGLPIAHGSTFSAMLSPGREEGAKRLPRACELLVVRLNFGKFAQTPRLGRSHTPTQCNAPSQRVRAVKENFALLWSSATAFRAGPRGPLATDCRPGRFALLRSTQRHCSGSVRGLRSHGAVREPPSHCSRGQCFLLGPADGVLIRCVCSVGPSYT